MKILIVGHGFVGKAVEYGFANHNTVIDVVDPKYDNSINDFRVVDYNFVFICVPTPMGSTGAIDTTAIDDVMSSINKQPQYIPTKIVIKSTVTPDILQKHGRPGVVFNPEFLREKTALQDFINPEFHILGGDISDTTVVQQLYENYSSCKPCPVYHLSYAEASIAKYAINSFLSTKVTFFNQLYDVAKDAGANFTKIISVISNDSRIGSSHMQVPGFDGKRGFGGACFPKDTSAFVTYSDKMSLLSSVIKINNEYRAGYELDDREKAQFILYNRADKK